MTSLKTKLFNSKCLKQIKALFTFLNEVLCSLDITLSSVSTDIMDAIFYLSSNVLFSLWLWFKSIGIAVDTSFLYFGACVWCHLWRNASDLSHGEKSITPDQSERAAARSKVTVSCLSEFYWLQVVAVQGVSLCQSKLFRLCGTASHVPWRLPRINFKVWENSASSESLERLSNYANMIHDKRFVFTKTF